MLTATSVIALLVYLGILGAAAFLVDVAPFLNPTFKSFINWVLVVVGVIVVAVFVLGLLGMGPGLTFKM